MAHWVKLRYEQKKFFRIFVEDPFLRFSSMADEWNKQIWNRKRIEKIMTSFCFSSRSRPQSTPLGALRRLYSISHRRVSKCRPPSYPPRARENWRADSIRLQNQHLGTLPRFNFEQCLGSDIVLEAECSPMLQFLKMVHFKNVKAFLIELENVVPWNSERTRSSKEDTKELVPVNLSYLGREHNFVCLCNFLNDVDYFPRGNHILLLQFALH